MDVGNDGGFHYNEDIHKLGNTQIAIDAMGNTGGGREGSMPGQGAGWLLSAKTSPNLRACDFPNLRAGECNFPISATSRVTTNAGSHHAPWTHTPNTAGTDDMEVEPEGGGHTSQPTKGEASKSETAVNPKAEGAGHTPQLPNAGRREVASEPAETPSWEMLGRPLPSCRGRFYLIRWSRAIRHSDQR